MFLYKLVDKFLMNNFNDEIILQLNKDNLIIFDIGCFIGNYSRNLKEKINSKNINFYLFDANPNIKIKDCKSNYVVKSSCMFLHVLYVRRVCCVGLDVSFVRSNRNNRMVFIVFIAT